MATECRLCWRNCGVEADAEIREMDRMEDNISPMPPNVSRIRDLISTLEMCHHKAERWVHNIIEAIGSGETAKGLGTRPPGQTHPAEQIWDNAWGALSAWCEGDPPAVAGLLVGTVPASQLLDNLGPRTPMKEWQVHRVIDRIREVIGWARLADDVSLQYVPLLEYGTEYESARRAECPECYRENADFWCETVETIIRDTEDGEPADVSLATAIDLLMPCNWNFGRNLEIVLGAIGGDLNATSPLALCARNVKLSPVCDRMKTVSRTLRVFYADSKPDEEADREVLALLGEPTDVNKWLAASLDKTIRRHLQM